MVAMKIAIFVTTALGIMAGFGEFAPQNTGLSSAIGSFLQKTALKINKF